MNNTIQKIDELKEQLSKLEAECGSQTALFETIKKIDNRLNWFTDDYVSFTSRLFTETGLLAEGLGKPVQAVRGMVYEIEEKVETILKEVRYLGDTLPHRLTLIEKILRNKAPKNRAAKPKMRAKKNK